MKLNFLSFNFKNPIFKDTLYLDKDGVLNEVIMRGSKMSSPRNLSELILDDNLFELNKEVISKSYNTVIISNQPDLSRGLISENFLLETLNQIRKHVSINAAYFCPHTIEYKCDCRKPKSDMLLHHRKLFPNSFDTELYIGDTHKDYIFASKLKIEFILKLHSFNQQYSKLICRKVNKLSELNLVESPK